MKWRALTRTYPSLSNRSITPTPLFQFALEASLFRFSVAGPSMRSLLQLPNRMARINPPNPLFIYTLLKISLLYWRRASRPPTDYATWGAYPAGGRSITPTPMCQFAIEASLFRSSAAEPSRRPLEQSPNRMATLVPAVLP